MDREIYYQVYRIERTHWWYVARRLLVLDLIARWAPNVQQVLDAGCGTGVNIEYLSSVIKGDFYGFDLSGLAVGFARDRGLSNLFCADGVQIPSVDQRFDLVTALDVVEHIEDDGKFFREVGRLLRQNGKLVIFVPALMSLWGEHDEVAHHFRRYSRNQLLEKLTTNGFRVEKLSYANTLLFPVIYLARRILRRIQKGEKKISENDLHPSFANGLLLRIFSLEKYLLRLIDLPIGVSLICVATKTT
jgi:SAM-dependent methyltransferase